MKPLKLIMQAFGTFARETIIDFSKLNNQVFLIFGKTGSGKTTIFDAICYALYGEVTGDLRNKDVAKNVRSSYADNKTPTIVSYEFTINGDVYKITRTPGKQEIEKKTSYYKNERVKIEKNNVDITLARVEENNKYIINEIIKLNREQFKQTMMISQGDFAALIKSDSKERTSIFRTILDTKKIDDIAIKLKNKTLELERSCKEIITSLKTLIQSLDEDLFEENYYQDNILSEGNYTVVEDIINYVNEVLKNNILVIKDKRNDKAKIDLEIDNKNQEMALINQNNSALLNYQKHLEKLNSILMQEKLIKEYKEKLMNNEKASRVNQYYQIFKKSEKVYLDNVDKIKNTKNLLTILREKENQINDDFSKITYLNSENDGLKLKVEKINELLNLFKEYDKVKEELLITQKNKEKIEKEKDEYSRQYECENKKIQDANNYILENANIHALIHENNLLKNNNQEAVQLCTTLNGDYNKINEKENKKINLQKEQIILFDKYKTANTMSLDIEEKFIKNQAGFIAKSLKEGMECPVCGSKVHPNICKDFDENYTKEKVDAAKKIAEDCKNAYEQKNSELLIEINNIDNLKNNLLKAIKDSFQIDISYEDILSFLQTKKNQLEKESKELEEKSIKINYIYEEYKKNEKIVKNNKLDQIKKQFEDKNKEYTDISNLYSGILSNVKSFENKLINLNQNELLQNKLDYNLKISTNEKLINTYRQNKADFEKEIAQTEGVLKTCENNDENYKNSLNDARKNLLNAEKENNFKHEDIDNYLLSDFESNDIKDKIESFNTDLNQINALINEEKAKGVDKYELKDVSIIDNQINSLRADSLKLNEEINHFEQINNVTLRQIQSIKDKHNDYENMLEKYLPYKELSEVFNGEVSRKKITFETFYQVQFFKQILIVASKRFNKMTDGKYSLVYKEEFDGGAKKEGLDMEVLDNYNALKRNIGTLSGGESFMASLALALSMSDIIKAKAGGISMDSMFIDEGFGTLDPEALNNAVNQIASLSYNGKTIGLISHVEELKNRIPNQIHVIKTENGSIIE